MERVLSSVAKPVSNNPIRKTKKTVVKEKSITPMTPPPIVKDRIIQKSILMSNNKQRNYNNTTKNIDINS